MFITNVGTIDRLLRIILGTALIGFAVGLYGPPINPCGDGSA